MRAASPALERADLPGAAPLAARAFDGWRVLGVMLVSQTLAIGTTTYAYSLFVKPIGEELGVDPARLGVGPAGLLFVLMLIGPAVGAALDRRSIRAMVIAGALCMALGFAAMAAAPSVWVLAACYWGLVSVGSLLTGPVSANKLVTNWFVRMRGRALGLASIGTSTGGMLIPPLCAWAIVALGWRGALLLLAGITLVAIVPAVALVVANRPEDRGQDVDGDPSLAPDVAEAVEAQRIPLGTLLRDPRYWGIALSFGLAWAVIAALFSFFSLYVEELGLGVETAALVLSVLSICAVPGKLIFGAAAERIEARKLVWLGLGLQLVFIAVLRSRPSSALLIGSSVAFGFGLGGLLPMHGTMVAACYGRSSFGSVLGAMGPVMTPLMFLAIGLASWLPSFAGGYARLFDVFLAAQVMAVLALFLVRPARKG